MLSASKHGERVSKRLDTDRWKNTEEFTHHSADYILVRFSRVKFVSWPRLSGISPAVHHPKASHESIIVNFWVICARFEALSSWNMSRDSFYSTAPLKLQSAKSSESGDHWIQVADVGRQGEARASITLNAYFLVLAESEYKRTSAPRREAVHLRQLTNGQNTFSQIHREKLRVVNRLNTTKDITNEGRRRPYS